PPTSTLFPYTTLFRSATPMHAKNEKPGEKQIAQDRVPEKHPGRCGAIGRQTDGQCLDETGEIFGITRIEDPGNAVRYDVENDRRSEEHTSELQSLRHL